MEVTAEPKTTQSDEASHRNLSFSTPIAGDPSSDKLPFFRHRSRQIKRDTWLVSVLVLLQIVVFAVTMGVNDCSRNSNGHCAAKLLGRFSFQPLSENPMLGPSASTFEHMGGLYWNALVEKHEIWRVLTSPWLHSALFHLLINLGSLIFVGIFMEQRYGPYARKFLKRKDSDAAEAGRALEELRSSLYNELKTSEGAKRQQQRFCGPVVAMSFNFVVAVGIILANKLVMGRVGFNFPIFLTLIHYAVAWILLAFFKSLSLLPMSPPSKTTPFSSLFSLGAVMAFASGLANTSLKHNSVGFYQMAKIAVTPTIVLAEFVLFKKTISSTKVMALAVVSLGVAIATVTDLEFNLFGALVAVAWIIPSAINKILWSNLQQQANWTALALMWKTTPFTVFFLLALMPWLDPPGVLLFKWDWGNSSAILVSALLGFLLQWSGALALGATSATSHVVLGQFKTCVILLGGYVIFGSDPGFISICGALAALAGMSVYTWLNLPGKSIDYSSSKLLPKQNTAVSKPKADSDDVGGETGVALLSVELDLSNSKTTSANIV